MDLRFLYKFFHRILAVWLVYMTMVNTGVMAQDAHFTQFNMSPMHYNPAFTGYTYAPLIHLNSRVQWPGIDWAYNTVSASYDQYFKKYRSGIGMYLMNDMAGNGIYNTLRIEALYAYGLRIHSENFLKMGIGLAFVQNRLNWNKLIFLDQLDPSSGYLDALGNPNMSDEVPPEKFTLIYPDISVGLLYYSRFFYAGVGIKHAGSPQENYVTSTSNNFDGLAVRYTIHAGGQLPLMNRGFSDAYFLHPSVIFIRQANITQISGQLNIKLGTIYAGIGYRHAIENADALIFGVGVEIGMYTFGYSYDLTVSSLSPNTGGSHEVGFRINFDGSEWFEKPYRYADCFEIFR
jgi:type IX secretion system PorP/SprF family membrane protein